MLFFSENKKTVQSILKELKIYFKNKLNVRTLLIVKRIISDPMTFSLINSFVMCSEK